jgi:CheY-like chemotaxis protein
MSQTDQSNYKEKEKQLKSVAHDLNNILSSTLHSITLLKQKIDSESDEYSLIEIIESNSNKASDILEDILDSTTSVNRILNIPRIINEVLLAFSNTLPADVKITTDFESDVYKTFGSRSDVYRVIMNLLLNAKEAIDEKGIISLALSNLSYSANTNKFNGVEEGNYVLLTISDTGCGIDPDNLDDIFLDGFSTKDKGRISGLGLNIVSQIINSIGGHIFVESEVKKGTVFSILLPEYKRRELPKAEGAPKTILVAEDDQTLLKLLSELLESYNFTVIKADDGIKVLSEFKSGSKIDLVIIDKKMPLLDGLDCVKQLRDQNISIPVILSSGSKGEIKHGLLEDLKIERVLNKPYDFEQMLSLIEELVY